MCIETTLTWTYSMSLFCTISNYHVKQFLSYDRKWPQETILLAIDWLGNEKQMRFYITHVLNFASWLSNYVKICVLIKQSWRDLTLKSTVVWKVTKNIPKYRRYVFVSFQWSQGSWNAIYKRNGHCKPMTFTERHKVTETVVNTSEFSSWGQCWVQRVSLHHSASLSADCCIVHTNI